MGNGPYGNWEEGDQKNFEMIEEVSPDGLRRTFTRGRPLTAEGRRIVADQQRVYDAAFPEHFQDNGPRSRTKGIARLLFGRD